MIKACAPLVACAALAVPSFAEQPLMCFGNEPSWKVDLTTPGVAKAAVMGEETKTYRGGPTRNEVLKETLWRGSPDAGRDLVVFLSDKSCSDQMSDVVHPVTARASFPDGRFFAGCCRVVGGARAGGGECFGSPGERLAPPEPPGQGREGPGRRAAAADDAVRSGPRVRLLGLQPARRLLHRRGRRRDPLAAGGDHDGVPRAGDGARECVPRGARGTAALLGRGRPAQPEARLRRAARARRRGSEARWRLEGQRLQQRPRRGRRAQGRRAHRAHLREAAPSPGTRAATRSGGPTSWTGRA